MKQYHYQGVKRPIPPMVTLQHGLSYDLLCKSTNSIQAALEKDTSWLISVLQQMETDDPTPEWTGAMVASSRADGSAHGPGNHFVFAPLIYMPLSHSDTILTTLMFLEESLQTKPFVHLSADMQLYKGIQEIKWSDPSRWQHLIVCPGGMHILMSFFGCVGTLINGSGLEDILSVAFKGVASMLNGKAWPKAIRDLSMVLTAILQPIVMSGKTTVEDIQEELDIVRFS